MRRSSDMAVDFRIKSAPGYTVACITTEAAYSDRAIRTSFEKVEKWITSRGLRGGKWIFTEQAEGEDRIKWEACIELKGKARGSGGVSVRTLKPSDVVSVKFNPDQVSSSIVYHAISDWIRWRKKDGTIARTGRFREIYNGNPWKSMEAWQNIEVQLLIVKGRDEMKDQQKG
ncbi:MAG: GyrI-like domain-containing protein [Candidatus Thermoplasmatota archaeon]|nr:GyrI-like domain-containing protein [Candidatus Thermoplasmatota archaeon]